MMGPEPGPMPAGTGTRKTSRHRAVMFYLDLEATGGFEPPNRGFADLRLSPLGYVAAFPVNQFRRVGAEGGI